MNNKKIHITFDYELFFGANSGSVNKCMIEPTNSLLELGIKYDSKFVFFIDAGFLWAMQNHINNPECVLNYNLVAAQIKTLSKNGHEIALHVHPHWEDCKFVNRKWIIDTKRYKLSDFSGEEVVSIIDKYHKALIKIIGTPCESFRAGGWCVQPFSILKNALEKNKIFIDSSVYKNGFHEFTAQSYDFRNAPDKTSWKFENNECLEDEGGKFTEIAITPDLIPPSFYFSLYLKMKINPEKFKPIGDGVWLKDKKKIYSQFYSNTSHFACCDGYFASRLTNILLKLEAEGKHQMLVLGHPKSLAKCSFNYLEDFIKFSKQKGYSICTLK